MPNLQHHAVVVGINDYPLSGMPSLGGPVNDALDFCTWLSDPTGGDLPLQNIRRVLSTDFRPKEVGPMPNQVEALFEPFVLCGVQGRFAERLYVFAAGHGFGDPGSFGRTALYAANAKKMFPWHVAITDYVEWLRRHAVFDEIVLIMDCCRTINSFYAIREPQYVVSSGNPDADRVRCFQAFAVGRGRVAREREFEYGRISGIFTRTLLDALRMARPERGMVTGQLVKNYIHNSIGRFAGDKQVEPPEIQLDSNRDIVFLRRKAAGTIPVKVVLSPSSGKETLILYDGSFKEVRREAATAAVVTLDLEPGLYKIAVGNAAGRQKIFEVPNNEQITV